MSRPVRFLLYKPIVMSCDVCLVNAGFLMAVLLRRGSHALMPHADIASLMNMSAWLSLATLLVFHMLDLYRDWLRRSLRHVLYSILIAVGMTLLSSLGLAAWGRPFAFPRSVLVIAAFLQIALLCSYRVQMRRLYRRWFGNRTTVVIGETEEDASLVAQKFEEHDVGLYRMQGHLLRRDLGPPWAELDAAETVVLSESLEQKEDIILHCFRCGKEVLVVPNLSELTLFGAEAREVDDLLILGIQPHRLNPAEELLKRSFDLLASSALLLVASPILLIVGIVIRATSTGPVFYRQERIGRWGKPFHVLKFRTMVNDAEKHSGPVLACERDPRITEFGRLLRAMRIDELPQMLNVIKGEMSLVGPRPERPYFVRQFEKELPAYELRHAVKPGITGLAQVMGKYGTTVESKLNFDLLYIYNYSLLLDLKILLQTVRVVLQGQQTPRLRMRGAFDRRVPPALDRIRRIEEIAEPGSSQTD
ncbi:MAG TPA: sugar transferase [Candidatus Binatia bacterium]|nr:sugar transferase [Candidatus Binatia bacterium]